MSKSQAGTKSLSDFKVTEIRKVLVGRGLDGNGVKATLVARLERVILRFIYIQEKQHILPILFKRVLGIMHVAFLFIFSIVIQIRRWGMGGSRN